MNIGDYFSRSESTVSGGGSRRNASRCLYFHLYYKPLPQEIAELIKSDPEADLAFTIVKGSPAHEEISSLQSDLSQFEARYRLFIVENMGSDVLPFLYLIWLHVFDRYGWVAKVHYKKTARRASLGDWWRQTMLHETIVDGGRIIRSGLADKSNLVGPQGLICAHPHFWVDNFERSRQLLSMLDVDISHFPYPFFFAGTSFWCSSHFRNELELLFDAPMMDSDLSYSADGTFGHAFERIAALIELGHGRVVIDSRGKKYSLSEGLPQIVAEPIYRAFLA